MKEERLQILQMLKEEKISVEEANSLLEALGADATGNAIERLGGGGRGRFLKVRVVEQGTQRVNLSFPLDLIRVVARWMPRHFWQDGDCPIDWEEVVGMIQEGLQGKLVDVTDEDGTHVEVSVS